MGYSSANLHGRLSRIETRLNADPGVNCPACFGGHRLEMIYKGDTPKGCPACGKVGSLVVVEPEIGSDGRPAPARAEELI